MISVWVSWLPLRASARICLATDWHGPICAPSETRGLPCPTTRLETQSPSTRTIEAHNPNQGIVTWQLRVPVNRERR
jgi:hypothetical protein